MAVVDDHERAAAGEKIEDWILKKKKCLLPANRERTDACAGRARCNVSFSWLCPFLLIGLTLPCRLERPTRLDERPLSQGVW